MDLRLWITTMELKESLKVMLKTVYYSLRTSF